MVLNDPVKWTWPLPNLRMYVTDGFQWSCQGKLTKCQYLSILSEYGMILNDPVKLTWPFFNICPSSGSKWWLSMMLTWPLFHNICPSSGCMWWFSMILLCWPDHFSISVFQDVCDGSQCSCQVDLTTSQSLHPQLVCDGSQWSFQVTT